MFYNEATLTSTSLFTNIKDGGCVFGLKDSTSHWEVQHINRLLHSAQYATFAEWSKPQWWATDVESNKEGLPEKTSLYLHMVLESSPCTKEAPAKPTNETMSRGIKRL